MTRILTIIALLFATPAWAEDALVCTLEGYDLKRTFTVGKNNNEEIQNLNGLKCEMFEAIYSCKNKEGIYKLVLDKFTRELFEFVTDTNISNKYVDCSISVRAF